MNQFSTEQKASVWNPNMFGFQTLTVQQVSEIWMLKNQMLAYTICTINIFYVIKQFRLASGIQTIGIGYLDFRRSEILTLFKPEATQLSERHSLNSKTQETGYYFLTPAKSPLKIIIC